MDGSLGWESPSLVWSRASPLLFDGAIDDATGKLLAARFFPFEGSSGYLWLLKDDRQEARDTNDHLSGSSRGVASK